MSARHPAPIANPHAAASPCADAPYLTGHGAVRQALEKLAYPFVSHNIQGA